VQCVLGRSRGGRNTKVHAIADARGRLLAILLSGGEVHDCPPAPRLIRRAKKARKLLGDKAYDSADLRQWLKCRGTRAVVPNRSNGRQPASFDKNAYKQRHLIENAFCRLKDFRRIATRYDRLARKLPHLRLPCRRYRMVDLMSPDPSPVHPAIRQRDHT
jgi:transposase